MLTENEIEHFGLTTKYSRFDIRSVATAFPSFNGEQIFAFIDMATATYASVELAIMDAQLMQANANNILPISFDCYGRQVTASGKTLG